MDPAKVVGLIFNGDDRPISRYYYPYGPSANGNGIERWGRVVKKAGGFMRRRLGKFRKIRSRES